LHRKELQAKGLKIFELESDQALQDAVLSVHHAYTYTLMNSNAVKIIESGDGVALIRNVQMQFVQGPMGAMPIQIPVMPQAPAAPPPPPQQQQAPQKLPVLQRLVLALRFLFLGR
jgi:hypothetical protein